MEAKSSTSEDDALVVFDRGSLFLQQFNPRLNEWKEMQALDNKMKKKNFSSIALNQHIYVLMEGNYFYRLKYDDKDAAWERLQSPLENHGWFSEMTVVNGDICVVGWSGGLCYTTSVEKYDSVANQWIKMNDKNVNCDGNAVACVKESLYSVGGREVLDSIKKAECYNLNESTWSFISPMLNARLEPAAVEFQNCLYVLGGSDERQSLKTVETYNPSTNTWTMLEPMITGRWLLNPFIFEGNIYAVGGWNEFLDSTNSIEKYDPEKKSWEIIDISKDIQIYQSVKIQAI